MTSEDWMRQAIACANQALALDEVPIGCVIVHLPTNQVIGRGFNQRQTNHDPTAHAEILAMREAGQNLNHWRLLDCDLLFYLPRWAFYPTLDAAARHHLDDLDSDLPACDTVQPTHVLLL